MVGLRLGLLLLVFMIVGCETLTPEEELRRADDIEWNDQIDLMNWLMCDELGILYWHYDHGHSRWDRSGRVSRWDIKSDLRDNNCYSALRDRWLHY